MNDGRCVEGQREGGTCTQKGMMVIGRRRRSQWLCSPSDVTGPNNTPAEAEEYGENTERFSVEEELGRVRGMGITEWTMSRCDSETWRWREESGIENDSLNGVNAAGQILYGADIGHEPQSSDTSKLMRICHSDGGGRQTLGNNLSCRPSGLHTEKRKDADYRVNNTQRFATNFQSASGHLHPAAEREIDAACVMDSRLQEMGVALIESTRWKVKPEWEPLYWPEDEDCAYELEVALDTVWMGRPVEVREGMSQHAPPTRNYVEEALRGIINRREDERGVGVWGHRPAQTLVKVEITRAEIDGKRR
ncbi:hypothetical protein DFH08DRAFT_819913 [Mycena albidolilacea]|uniref:Uncharacterized protein n=1 Tax=Mycena albidolilacea TaxID=1033008 RepID=A0AAD7EEL0_9AGAR|nr:hypothetical protein DFH08DRAFT_819913 [Mycena albidolilacea]